MVESNKQKVSPKRIKYNTTKTWVKIDQIEILYSDYREIKQNCELGALMSFIFSWIDNCIKEKDDTIDKENIFYKDAREELKHTLFEEDSFILLEPGKWRIKVAYEGRFCIKEPLRTTITLFRLTGEESTFTIKE